MDVCIGPADTGMVVSLAEENFDAIAVADVRSVLERVIAEHRGDVYIDLRRVTLIDSAAIGLIAFAFKRLRAASRRLIMIGPSGQPKQILELLRIDRVIDVRPALPGEESNLLVSDAPAEGVQLGKLGRSGDWRDFVRPRFDVVGRGARRDSLPAPMRGGHRRRGAADPPS